MANKIERRNLTQEFRVAADGETPTIAGYAAVFDVSSEDMGFIEIIDPHAFDSVLAGLVDCRALWNHNPDHVLGRTTANTLHLSVDARGLAYVIDTPDTTCARDLIVSMRRGDVTQSSFGFICKRDQWTDNQDGSITRRILEFDVLLDVSPVTYPAFTQASAGVRSLPESMPVEMRSRLEAVKPSVRALTDGCTCTCPQCMSANCGICSMDPQCDGAERASARSAAWKLDAELHIRLAEAS